MRLIWKLFLLVCIPSVLFFIGTVIYGLFHGEEKYFAGQNDKSTTEGEIVDVDPSSVISVSDAKLFYIALSDEGKVGDLVGCGDSIVSVPVNFVPPTKAPLRSALEKLFGNTSTTVLSADGRELFNALHNATITIDSVSIVDGIAAVRLSGSLKLGGVCDDPRAIAQIEKTVSQFSTVKRTSIYFNNRPLRETLSEKGSF